jgi:hypothetical protein
LHFYTFFERSNPLFAAAHRNRFSVLQLVLANFVPPKHSVVLSENKGLCRITAEPGGLFVCNLRVSLVFVVQIAMVWGARQISARRLTCPRITKAKTDADLLL